MSEPKTYVRVEREIVEARIYERAVEIELNVRPGQTKAIAQTIIVSHRSGAKRAHQNGLAMSLRTRRVTAQGLTSLRASGSFDMLSLLKGHASGAIAGVFMHETIERLTALAREVEAEFEWIDWEAVKP
ncbi:hypothetical protein SEA_PICKLES13_56 [Microbacterium phage Pickles13]|nr:hypothetical protein SEA_PICKLES13_56 [Microbacterium phage Pickles13]